MQPGDVRTRFIKDRQHRPRVYPTGELYAVAEVFLPRPAKQGSGSERQELSTFMVDGMDEDEVWALGYEHYLEVGRSMKGRADLPTSRFSARRLGFVEQVPPPRHGSFVDWPDDAEERLAIATDLASYANAYRHPAGKSGPPKV